MFSVPPTHVKWHAGLDITDEQLEEMRAQVDNIDWDYAAKKEAEFRHDVMGHVHAFGHVCPKVGGGFQPPPPGLPHSPRQPGIQTIAILVDIPSAESG